MSENRARDFSRRSFLKGTAAVSLGQLPRSLGTATSVAWMAPAAAAELPPTPPHGAELRGMDLVTKSPTTEGRFGFMFKNQPPHPASETLLDRPGCDHGGTARRHRPAARVTTRTTTTPSTRTPTRRSRRGSPSSASSSTTTSPSTPRPSASSSPTPTPPPTSARPATTSTPSTDWAPTRDPQFYDPSDRDKFQIVETSLQHRSTALKVTTS